MVDVPTFTNPLSPAVFVFGSNLAGRVEHGACQFAHKYYDAKPGTNQGMTGDAYAIPTENADMQPLSLYEITQSVNKFIAFAYSNRDRFFQVTRIACGATGYSDEQIAPLFDRAPANVWLPGKWLLLRNRLERARLIVTGSTAMVDQALVASTLAAKTAPWGRRFEVITTHAQGVATFAEQWARSNDLPITPFVADYERFGADADSVSNHQMAWYGTVVINFADGTADLTLDMTSIAKQEGLKILVVPCATPGVLA
jgi:hypothetical protein